jgi:hypothetical protein
MPPLKGLRKLTIVIVGLFVCKASYPLQEMGAYQSLKFFFNSINFAWKGFNG